MAKKRAAKPPRRDVEASEAAAEKRSRSLLDLAAPVAAVVNLKTILVEECSARRAAEAHDTSKSYKTLMEHDVAEIGRSKGGDSLNVSLRFTLNVYNKEVAEGERDGDDDSLISMMCKFVVIYSLSNLDNIEDENLLAFGKTSGVFSVWPYWREYVHSTTFRLSVPPIVLPTYRVNPL
jgi:hypothetical protein